MNNLDGKIAWIIGAGSGIGHAAAMKLAQAGVSVVLSGRRKEKLNEVAVEIEESGSKAMVAPLDITEAKAVQQVFGQIQKRYSRLDILVNSAGLNVPKRNWHDVSFEGWEQVVNVDLNGAFYCCKTVLPIMRKQQDGLIINISSWIGRFPKVFPGPAYAAAKHAMNAMNMSLNMEENKNGIRACTICPGEVATPIVERWKVPATEEEKSKMLQSEDLGETILFVAKMPPHACVNEILISPTINCLH